MKLLTSIKPRRDGVVTLVGEDGVTCYFMANDRGDLVAEVADEATIVKCLSSGNFEPADEADFEAAEALLAVPGVDDDAADDDGDSFESDPEAAPVEANTPPAAAPGRGKKAGKKAA